MMTLFDDEQIARYVPSLSMEELKELEAELLQLA